MDADVQALFADVAGIGPFFAVATGPAPPGAGWVPVAALAGPTDRVDDPLRARIAAVRTALRTDERVAASTAFQGLAAQLVSPLFAAVAVHGVLPAPDPATWTRAAVPEGPQTATCDHEVVPLADAVHWRPGGAGPWLWWAEPGCVRPGADDGLVDVLAGLLTPLVAAVRARVSISQRVLWSDAASAVASARRLVVAARPTAADRATAVAERLLAAPPLAVAAALRAPEPPDAGWSFRRRSCCLYYRVPGGGVCDDCVLRDVPRDRPARPPRRAVRQPPTTLARRVAPPSPAP